MEIKDLADAIVKVAAINDKRAKAFDDFRSGIDLINKVSRLMDIRTQYTSIANWLLLNRQIKGYNTQEEEQLGNACLEGIMECNNEQGKAYYNYMVDKVQSELLSFLYGKR